LKLDSHSHHLLSLHGLNDDRIFIFWANYCLKNTFIPLEKIVFTFTCRLPKDELLEIRQLDRPSGRESAIPKTHTIELQIYNTIYIGKHVTKNVTKGLIWTRLDILLLFLLIL